MSADKATPRPWYVLKVQDRIFVAAKPTEDHPYFGKTRNIDVAGDEDYPRKEADCELIVRAVNAHQELVDALNDFSHAMRDQEKPDLLALINALHKADAALARAEGSHV